MARRLHRRRSVPIRATYRLQLRPELGLDDAAALAPYLAELGVSHLYASPYLQAVAGSTHGYDVVDPTRVNEELGGEAAHVRLAAALAAHGLGQVLDIVPNHMAIDERTNRWWWDVLENGPASRYAAYFDVDWDPPQARLRNTVLLPVLGDHYGRVLEAGELALGRQGGGFEVRYGDHRWPVAPRSLDGLLGAAAGDQRPGGSQPADGAGWDTLAFLAAAFGDLPAATATDRESTARRHRDKEVLRAALARLLAERPEIAAAVDAEIARVNADPDRLDALLERQNYRPAFWRTAGSDLDYRRFFDVTALAALRSEDERVFADVHARPLGWVAAGILDGLRIDHPDGLYDPAAYLARLRAAAPAAWIVVEKILAGGERLPADWPVAGTTGYDFLNRVHRLFVDPRGEEPLGEIYRRFLGIEDGAAPPSWAEISRQARLQVLDELLAADLERLTQRLREVCERHRRHRDYTRQELRQALRETAASLPVYRTYVRADPSGRQVSAADRAAVGAAIEAVRAARPDLPPDLFDFLAELLLLELPGEAEADCAMRFQQLTAPAMAKGVEDTAFYRYHRLVSLNEVGGDPSLFAVEPAAFHRSCAEAQERFPQGLIATSTHDTKRSEDVRARLALLSEIPERWSAAVARWAAWNSPRRLAAGGFPDADAEYLLYQTLVGAWPLTAERAARYMEKACREAKRHTSWTRPEPAYEAAVREFVHAILADPAFAADLAGFVAPLVALGRINSLAQTLLKLVAPGVPDFYQGSELWDLSLVDPDNRRPVDFALRRRLLRELAGIAKHPDAAERVLARADEGLPKLWTIRQALALRRRRPDLFAAASAYRPLAVRGEKAGHAMACARGGGDDSAVAVVPRLVIGLGDGWGDTAVELPGGRFRDELTGEEVAGGPRPLADLLARFPVALLAPLAD